MLGRMFFGAQLTTAWRLKRGWFERSRGRNAGLTFQSSMNPWSLHARSPESSMDPISVQIERLSVQITGPWTISSAFFAEIPSMDPVLMHAVVQGPRIGAETSVICADIGSMDEYSSRSDAGPHLGLARPTWLTSAHQTSSFACTTYLAHAKSSNLILGSRD